MEDMAPPTTNGVGKAVAEPMPPRPIQCMSKEDYDCVIFNLFGFLLRMYVEEGLL